MIQQLEEVIDVPSQPCITISEKVGCGYVYLLIETKNGIFDKLTIKGTMAKSCDCGESFLQAIGKILTFSIRRAIKEGTLEEGILNHLKGHRCNIPIYKGSLSCVDGIAKGMKKFFENEVKNAVLE